MPKLLAMTDDDHRINTAKLLADESVQGLTHAGSDEDLLNEGGIRRAQQEQQRRRSGQQQQEQQDQRSVRELQHSLVKEGLDRCDRCLKSETFRQLMLGYDYAAQMMISVLWAYIVPLAGQPKNGCPNSDDASEHACWDKWVPLLAAYAFVCTFAVPLFSIVAVKHCSKRAREMGRRSNFFRRKFYARGERLFGAALQTTWSVSMSQLLYYVVGQFAASGWPNGSGDGDDPQPPPQPPTPDPTSPPPPYRRDDDDGGGGHIHVAPLHHDLARAALRLGARLLNDGDGSHDFFGPDNHGGEDRGGRGNMLDQEAETRDEALRGALASFVLGCLIFLSAVLCISSISAVCRCSTWALERCGLCCCHQSPYLIELSLLLQNNWYYVLGYSWEMFWSYIFFSTVQTSDLNSGANICGDDDDDSGGGGGGGDGDDDCVDDDGAASSGLVYWVFMLDLVRAVLYTAVFSFVAVHCLPFDARVDMDPATTAVKPRLRLLVFRSTAVLVVVALADVPTSFVTKFLADDAVLGLNISNQLLLLYGFAAAG